MPDPQGLAKDARQAPEFVLRGECRAFPARRSLAAKSGCRDDTHSLPSASAPLHLGLQRVNLEPRYKVNRN
jgi:hypothetical protein